MAVGMKMLADGEGDAFVSAGSTGALVVGATFIVKRIRASKTSSCNDTSYGNDAYDAS